MKTFKDLKVTDALYIVRDDGFFCVCKVVRMSCLGIITRIYYDYADKYTENNTVWYFDVNMKMCDEETSIEIALPGYVPFVIYLNRDDILKELDERIENLKKQKRKIIKAL